MATHQTYGQTNLQVLRLFQGFWILMVFGPKLATMASNLLARELKVKFSDYYSIDISVDVHVKRVFHRLGLTKKKSTTEQVIYKARALNPEFPWHVR